MITCREVVDGRETFYIITQTIGNTKLTDTIRFIIKKTTDSKGRPYRLFYNNNWEIDYEACGFLNDFCSSLAENTVIKAGEAMKLLRSYERISGRRLEDFDRIELDLMLSFMLGYGWTGRDITYAPLTTRSHATVNNYLAIYRKYLRYIKKTNFLLSETKANHYTPSLTGNGDTSHVSYVLNLQTPDRSLDNISYYIRVNEYQKMQEIIGSENSKYSLRDSIIITLEYLYGLRIGEVLGITKEDLQSREYINKTTGERGFGSVILIRNRTSDKNYQKAKKCMQVTDRVQYKTKEYNTYDYGYQAVFLDNDFYNLLMKYVEDAEEKGLYENADADSIDAVMVNGKIYEDNSYIFVNTKAYPLTQARWNQILRSIYAEAEIPVDTGTRQHNLNHRLRHGFAFFCKDTYKAIHGEEISRGDLKDLMRHQSEESVFPYFRRNEQEKAELIKEFHSKMIDPLVPFLHKKEWFSERYYVNEEEAAETA